ncbi:MAG: LysR family transcriptional regulator [Alphaproteobacteria bacterium]
MAKQAPRFRGALGDVDIRLLRVFRAVAEAGGLAAAESVLNVGRSTISMQIADLEARLGMRLCRRGRGGFALTEQGEVVHAATMKLLASLEDFRAEVNASEARLTGALNVGFVEHSIRHPGFRLDEALARFRNRAPEVHISLQARNVQDIEDAVIHGRLHVGIIILHRRRAGLVYRDLISEVQGPFCARSHPLFARADETITLKDIAAHDYVGRGYVDESRARQQYLGRVPSATAHNLEAVMILVLTGRYIGIMPTDFAEEWVRRGEIRMIAPARTAYRREFTVIMRKGIQPTPVVTAFLADLYAAHPG